MAKEYRCQWKVDECIPRTLRANLQILLDLPTHHIPLSWTILNHNLNRK